jgi:hypothetical protein
MDTKIVEVIANEVSVVVQEQRHFRRPGDVNPELGSRPRTAASSTLSRYVSRSSMASGTASTKTFLREYGTRKRIGSPEVPPEMTAHADVLRLRIAPPRLPSLFTSTSRNCN